MIRSAGPVRRARPVRGGDEALTKFMVIALGSGLPAYLVYQALEDRDLMIRFWGTLVTFAAGWYVSRSFVRNHLDL